MAWRFRWEDSGQDEFKAKLLAYNQADCNCPASSDCGATSPLHGSRQAGGRGLHEQAEAVGNGDEGRKYIGFLMEYLLPPTKNTNARRSNCLG